MSELWGIYGGTFSPPHRGHLNALIAFKNFIQADKIVVIPTYTPPHKNYHPEVSSKNRLEMCRLGFQSVPGVIVSDIEIQRGGLSYTSETLEALSRPNRKLAFLCGTDMMLTLGNWRNPETIFRLADIFCIRRENDTTLDAKIEETNVAYEHRFGKRVQMIDVPVLEGSSTVLRSAIKAGEQCDLMIPAVGEYIRKKGLYL